MYSTIRTRMPLKSRVRQNAITRFTLVLGALDRRPVGRLDRIPVISMRFPPALQFARAARASAPAPAAAAARDQRRAVPERFASMVTA